MRLRRLARGRRRTVLLGLLAALLACLAVGLFPQEQLRRLAERQLRLSLGPDAHIGGLHIVPGALSAEVRDLVIGSPTVRLEIPHGHIRFFPSRLLWGALSAEKLLLSIRVLELDSPRIVIRGGGPRGGESGTVPPLFAREVHVTNGTLVYTDPGLGGDLTFRGIEIRGGLGEGTLAVTARGGEWARSTPVSLGPARADLEVSPSLGLRVRSFTAQAMGSHFDARGTLAGPPGWTPDLALSARLELGDLAPFGTPAMNGAVTATGRLWGRPEAVSLEADVEGSGLRVAGWPIERARGKLAYQRAGPASAAWTLDLLSGRAEGDAHLRGSAVQGRLRITDLDLAGAARAARMELAPSWGGRASGKLDWSGDLAGSVQVTGDAQSRLKVGGYQLETSLALSGPVRMKPQTLALRWTASVSAAPAGEPSARVRLSALRLQAHGTASGTLPPAIDGDLEGEATLLTSQGPAPITIAGRLRSQGSDFGASLETRGLGGSLWVKADASAGVFRTLSVGAESLSLGPLSPDLGGSARLSFAGSGPWDRLSGSGELRIDDASWRGVEIGSVSLSMESRSGTAEATLQIPDLRASGQVRLRAPESPALTATLVFDDSPLAPLATLVPGGVPLAGSVSGSLHLEIPLGAPEATALDAQVEALLLTSGRLSARSRGPFALRVRGSRVEVHDLGLQGPGLSLDLSGSMGTNPSAPVDLHVSGSADLAELPLPADWHLSGRLETRLAVTGKVAQPRAAGFVAGQGLAIETGWLPALTIPEARVELNGDAAEIGSAAAGVAGGSLVVSGRVPLAALVRAARRDPRAVQPGEGANLSVVFEGPSAAPFFERLCTDRVSPLAAVLSGRLDLEGGLADVSEARAELRATAQGVVVQDVAFEVSPLTLRLRAGEVALEETRVSADGGTLQLAGHLDLGRRVIEATARGRLQLRALSPFLAETAVTGAADVDLTVAGPLGAPGARGSVTVHEGGLRIRALPQALTAIEARLVIDGGTARIENATAVFGGGIVTLEGSASVSGMRVSELRVSVSGQDLSLRYPEGLRSRLDAELTLGGRPGALQLSGIVKVQRGLYDLDVALEGSLLTSAVTRQSSPLLRSIGLDLRVEIVNPVLVRNSLAQLEASGNLTIRGDLETPAPIGRLEILPGGKLLLQQRAFVIESGRLIYGGTWDPEISVRAKAVLRNVDLGVVDGVRDVQVQIQVDGQLERPRLAFTSDPGGYADAEIVSMIAANRATRSGLSSSAWVTGEQAALFLTGRLTRGVARELQGLGIDEVTIQPELLARETEPGARFTFGKRLTESVRLIYSLSLNDPENRFVQLDAAPWRGVELLAQRRDDGSYGFGGGQRLRLFGLPQREPFKEEKARLAEVRFVGDRPMGEVALREVVRAKAGGRVSTWDLQDDADRLRDRLRGAGYLEAEATARLEGEAAVFWLRAGSQFRWRVEGMADPPDVSTAIRKALFGEEAQDRGRQRLLEVLHERGYLRAEVKVGAVEKDAVRTLVFTVQPGPRLTVAEARFPGASALSPSRLLSIAGGAARFLAAPEAAVEAIRSEYRKQYYLAVEISRPEVRVEGSRAFISVPVREGQRARAKAVRFAGATLPPEELRRAARIEIDAPYDESRMPDSVARLRDDYYGRGYPSVRVSVSAEQAGADLDVVFGLTEGTRVTVGSVEITGLSQTRESLVRSTMGIETGAPLDPRKLATAERKLLALGTFSRATITPSGDNPAILRVEVEEEARLALGYQLRYNDEKGASGDLEAEVRNLLGRGLAVGARYSRGANDEEIRGSLQLPSLAALGNLTASVFRIVKDVPGEADGPGFARVEKGVQLQAGRRLLDRWDLLYGYKFKNATVSSAFDEFATATNIAALDLSLLRDTRDNPMNARRGHFLSANVELSPAALGSDLNFIKGFVQAFLNRSLSPSLTWAQGYRLGLAHVFSEERLVFTERFKAGGGNSIRGFATDWLGPRDVLGEPAGGQAVLILNQELRYMHPRGVGVVVFYDAGNVFAEAGDLNLNLRHVIGGGLRWDSPVGLLRADVGFPLDRQPDEKRYRLFLGLGQAF